VAELPTGTVTFLFTDLESSTRLWDEHSEAMRAALARHDAILVQAVGARGGQVVKSTGDGLHAVFGAAENAVEAAVEAQRELTGEAWGETGPLRVRMGLHTGTAERRGEDYFGSTLNRAARLTAVAHGGQVVCSAATADLARDALATVEFRDLGEHRLRDLSRPERVFQVHAPGLQIGFGPLVSLDAFPGNLPLQVSSFIGRDRDLGRVARALEQARVVTLTGVGGVGKTRLALQVAAEVLPEFREGAWLCELAAIRDPDGVVGAVAAVFGVTARAGQSLEESLVEFLRTKQLLLVLDNCEHLLEAVAELVELLERSCGDLVVLATSREGLALEGEQVVPVPSLPEPAADADLDTVGRADAVHLFVERAQGVDPDFSLTAQNAAAVAQVCRRLDGVPLAIELAAARISAMNPAELASGLDRRFETLAGGRRRAVQRHQTLRAAIDWSYELCTEPEQRLLARLAVFAGGCTRDAGEAVCSGAPISEARVFELLADLVGRSLVVAEREHPETRYRLLETIREYAEERLAEHHETDHVRARHAEYYTGFAGSVVEEIAGPHQVEAGRRLIAEQENLLAAMNYAIDTDNVDLALRLLRGMPWGGAQVGYEVRFPPDPILGLTGAAEHPLYPFGLAAASSRAAQRGDFELADTLSAEALTAAQSLGDPDSFVAIITANVRVIRAYSIGALHDAATHSERTVEIGRSAGNRITVATGLAAAATFYSMAGEADAAVPLATEGLALARDIGMPHLIISNLAALAAALVDQDPQRARMLLHESIHQREHLGVENWAALTQAVLISARLQDWPQALALASGSISHLHWVGERALLGADFNIVARALAGINPQSAAVLQGAARKLTPAAPRRNVGDVDRVTLDPQTAANAERPSSTTSYLTQLRRETANSLRDALGERGLRELRDQGRAMNTDEAVAYALTTINNSQPQVDQEERTISGRSWGRFR
jgi:predicted ATPase/class 3 adenylate cyclase